MGTKQLNITRVARGKIEKDIDKELDELTKQLEEVINDNTVTITKIFYTSSTSGGSVDVKNTVKINKYGKIISWEQD